MKQLWCKIFHVKISDDTSFFSAAVRICSYSSYLLSFIRLKSIAYFFDPPCIVWYANWILPFSRHCSGQFVSSPRSTAELYMPRATFVLAIRLQVRWRHTDVVEPVCLRPVWRIRQLLYHGAPADHVAWRHNEAVLHVSPSPVHHRHQLLNQACRLSDFCEHIEYILRYSSPTFEFQEGPLKHSHHKDN